MNYAVELTSKAYRQYKKLPDKVRDNFKISLDDLMRSPEQFPFLSGKFSSLRKFKFHSQGTAYRAVFTLKENTVLITFLGTREGFYTALEEYMS